MAYTGGSYGNEYPVNNWNFPSPPVLSRNESHNESMNRNETPGSDFGNQNFSQGTYEYNSYFGSVYGNVNSFASVVLSLVTVVAIVATGATLLVVIFNKRLQKEHHIFPSNITVAGLVTAVSVGLRVLMPPDSGKCNFFCELMVYTPCFASLVSNISILMVAAYQLINVCIDPFGTRGIINASRCIPCCAVTWTIVFILGLPGFLYFAPSRFLLLLSIASISTTIFTGCAYFLIYRSVTGATAAGVISKQRKEENSRILQTIALVYGANFFLSIFPAAYWVMLVLIREWGPLIYLSTLSSVLSSVVNSIVYWWRMKEFRGILPNCNRRRRVEPTRDPILKTEQMAIENVSRTCSHDS